MVLLATIWVSIIFNTKFYKMSNKLKRFFIAIGNDFNGMSIKTNGIIERVKKQSYPFAVENDVYVLTSPDGYKFYVTDSAEQEDGDPVQNVIINSKDLQKTQAYWTDLLKMQLVQQSEKEISLTYGAKQAQLVFRQTGKYFKEILLSKKKIIISYSFVWFSSN